MKKESIPVRNSLLLLLTATIWGVAFVAQSVDMNSVLLQSLLLTFFHPLSVYYSVLYYFQYSSFRLQIGYKILNFFVFSS